VGVNFLRCERTALETGEKMKMGEAAFLKFHDEVKKLSFSYIRDNVTTSKDCQKILHALVKDP
jgi:hypothetical protein